MKLSKTAKKLLLLIDSKTVIDSTGELVCYWVPPFSGYNWCEYFEEPVIVDGAGHARCLVSLCNKGLTKEHLVRKYSYSITEKGRLVVDGILLEMGLRRKDKEK